MATSQNAERANNFVVIRMCTVCRRSEVPELLFRTLVAKMQTLKRVFLRGNKYQAQLMPI